MQSDLYRQAAIRARADKLFGVSLDAGSTEGRVFCAAALTFLVALIALATLSDYTKYATAVGFLTTTQGNFVQRAPRAGIVRDLQVTEGQFVKSAALILKLDPDRTGADVPNYEQALAVSAKREYLAAIDTSSLLDEQQQIGRQQLESQRRAAQSQIRLLARRHQYLNEQLEIQQTALAKFEALLARNMTSQNDVAERRLLLLQTQQSHALVTAQIQEKKDRVRLLGLEIKAASLSARQQLLESRTLEDKLGSAWLQARSRADLGVVASVAGKVSAIEVKVGQQVKQGEPLFTVLPDSGRYVVQLEVSDRVITQLSHGMNVRLRFDAFPWQKYGALTGTVIQFAQAPRVSQRASPAIWTVLVELTEDQAGTGLVDWSLSPGLRVQADIALERQSLLRWMLGPLLETLNA
ncbi:MAG: HlyD family efflux transporter periplasmic adaptor subunit [Pseudomonadota bacterium]